MSIIYLPLRIVIVDTNLFAHIRSSAIKTPIYKIEVNGTDRTNNLTDISFTFTKNEVPNLKFGINKLSNASLFPLKANIKITLGYNFIGTDYWFTSFTGKIRLYNKSYIQGVNMDRLIVECKGTSYDTMENQDTITDGQGNCVPEFPDASGTEYVTERVVTGTVRWYLGRVWIVWLTAVTQDESGNNTGEFARTGRWRYASQGEINSCKTANDRIEVRRGELARLEVKLDDIINSTGSYRNHVWSPTVSQIDGLTDKERAKANTIAAIDSAAYELVVAESEGRDCQNTEEFNPWIDLSVFGNKQVPRTVCDSWAGISFPGKCMQLNFTTRKQAIAHALALSRETNAPSNTCQTPTNNDESWWETPDGTIIKSGSGDYGSAITYDENAVFNFTETESQISSQKSRGIFEIPYDPQVGIKTVLTISIPSRTLTKKVRVDSYSVQTDKSLNKLTMRCQGAMV